jgi:hypothetical protein
MRAVSMGEAGRNPLGTVGNARSSADSIRVAASRNQEIGRNTFERPEENE